MPSHALIIKKISSHSSRQDAQQPAAGRYPLSGSAANTARLALFLLTVRAVSALTQERDQQLSSGSDPANTLGLIFLGVLLFTVTCGVLVWCCKKAGDWPGTNTPAPDYAFLPPPGYLTFSTTPPIVSNDNFGRQPDCFAPGCGV